MQSRHILVAAVTLALVAPATAQSLPPSTADSASPLHRLLRGHPFVYNHIRPAIASGPVKLGEQIGSVDTLPVRRSELHQTEYEQALALYEQGRYAESAALLRPAVADEPQNFFLLSALGSALFRVDSLRPESKRILKTLVLQIDDTSADTNALVIDLWFVDAYWKLAMLYLDDENYSGALTQLAKVAFAPQPNPQFRAEVYTYVAEALFNLHYAEEAQYYVDRTLELAPANQYVLRFSTRPRPK